MNSELSALRQALQALRQGQMPAHHFSALARSQAGLLAALPPPFEAVLFNLLDRLESSALFSDESCSFSQTDLLDSLQMWVDKAGTRLKAGDAANTAI